MNSLQEELKRQRQAHPGFSFVQCWNALKGRKPELFNRQDDSREVREAPAPAPMSNREMLSQLAAALELKRKCKLVQAQTGGSFAEAWSALRSREPELFSGDLIEAENSDSEFIWLRSEDVDVLLSLD